MKRQNLDASIYRILLAVLAGLLVLGNVGRISLTDRIAVYLQDGVLLAMFVWLVMHWTTARKILLAQTWIKPFAIFVSCIGLSLGVALVLNTPQRVFIGVAYAMRLLLYASTLLYIAVGIFKKYVSKSLITTGLIGVTVLIALLGLAQYIFLPDVRFLQYLGYDDHYFRLVSTYFDPPFVAQLLITGLFVTYSAKEISKKRFVLLPVLFIALLLTYSRAEYVAFVAGLVTYLIQTGKKAMLGVVGLLIVGIVLLPRPASEGARLERTQSIVARATVFMESMKSVDTRTFLVGRGWYVANSNRAVRSGISESHSSSSDNSYFQVFQSIGIIGLIAFLWFIWRVIKQTKNDTTIFPILISILVGSLANNIFFYPAVMLVFWTLLGTHKRAVA